MNAVDPFTAASPVYRAAIRHPHKTGEALEVSKPLSLCGEIAVGAIVISILLVCAALVFTAAAIISSLNGGN